MTFVHILAFIVLFVNRLRLHSLQPSTLATATVGFLAYQPDCIYNFGEGSGSKKSLIPAVCVILNEILTVVL